MALIRVPCPACAHPLPLAELLGRLDRSWPAARCCGFLCRRCRRYGHARLSDDRVETGRMGEAGFAPTGRVRAIGLRAEWGAKEVEIRYGPTVVTVTSR